MAHKSNRRDSNSNNIIINEEGVSMNNRGTQKESFALELCSTSVSGNIRRCVRARRGRGGTGDGLHNFG